MPRVVKTALVKADPLFSHEELPSPPIYDTLVKDYLLYGSNINRSSKGRPYRTKADSYLCDIRGIVWESVFQHGFHIGRASYTIADAAREKIQSDTIFEDILPDDVYDAIFLNNSQEALRENPNTDLIVLVREHKIVDIRKVVDNVKASVKRAIFKIVAAYIEKGSGSAHPPYNSNPKSTKHFGHAFSRHGAGAKNTNVLAGWAASTGKSQGQWTNNAKAANFLNSLLPLGKTTTVDIPPGLGQVVNPDGSTSPASQAVVVPMPNGTDIRTAYPVLGPLD